MMLYISRFAGIERFGVTDTDDGVETVVSLSQLKNILGMGIEVLGVDAVVHPFRGPRSIDIRTVKVCPPNVKGTTAQAKALIMYGVDVRSDKGRVTSVSWLYDKVGKNDGPVRIRLSEHGNLLENFSFARTGTIPTGMRLIFVLDDKIKVKKQSFQRFFDHYGCLVLDVSEVTSHRTLQYAYEEYFVQHRGDIEDVDRHIIDTEEHRVIWKAIGVVYSGALRYSGQSDDTSAVVAKHFMKDFRDMRDLDFRIRSNVKDLQHAVIYASQIMRHKEFWQSNPTDYKKVRDNDENALLFMQNHLMSNYYKAQRFMNYLLWFNPTTEVQKIYVDMCVRLNNWILWLAESNHWF